MDIWSRQEPLDRGPSIDVSSHYQDFGHQASLSTTLHVIKAPQHRRIRRRCQCSYLVSRSVHQTRVVAAPVFPGPRCKYLASVAAEQAFVGVHVVPEGLLDRNRSDHYGLPMAVGGFEQTSSFAEPVVVAGAVDGVGGSGIAERCWLAVMRAGL